MKRAAQVDVITCMLLISFRPFFCRAAECLEAQFYHYAAYGHSITAKQRGFGPLPVGGRRAKLSKGMLAIARDIANDEVRGMDTLFEEIRRLVEWPVKYRAEATVLGLQMRLGVGSRRQTNLQSFGL